ncbi:MAG TPA: cytochrome c [Vicinamibacterales bacterium]|nr:cytochrome c [Vicinamibacterales bacterium]
MRRTLSCRFSILLVCGITTVASLIAAAPDGVLPAQEKHSTTSIEPIVTPVTGPSWLNHLGLPYRSTSLGRGSGRYGPNANEQTPPHEALALPAGRSVEVTGADLYRQNCQACHAAEGTGTAPDVRSLLPMVQGSSIQLMQQKLRQEGDGADVAAARKQAIQMKRDLYTRIRQGGEKMPARAHLDEADIDMLYAYLTLLAGTSDAKPLTRRTVSWERLGENVVKGTCHICHDAVGPRPTAHALMNGEIPPLSTLRADRSVVDFVNKVRNGAATTMGDLPFHYRGRMPVFFYLKGYEVAAAYLYLNDFPPQRK